MTRQFDPKPVTLEGSHVRLEPLARRHAEDLFEVGQDETIWPYMSRPPLKSVEDARAWIDQALEVTATDTQIPFAIIERASGKAIGSTRYMDIRRNDRGLEIGWTWIGTAFQRTAMNTECKYLLLRHAFEDLGAVRVQAEDGPAQCALPASDRAPGRRPRRRPAEAHGTVGRLHSGHGLLQRHRERVARGQAPPGRPAGAGARLTSSLPSSSWKKDEPPPMRLQGRSSFLTRGGGLNMLPPDASPCRSMSRRDA